MSELRIRFAKSVLLCDKLGATFVCSNPMYHSKMKHVEVNFYFVHDKIAKGLLTVSHIPFEQQLADFLTKAHSLSKLGPRLAFMIMLGLCIL